MGRMDAGRPGIPTFGMLLLCLLAAPAGAREHDAGVSLAFFGATGDLDAGVHVSTVLGSRLWGPVGIGGALAGTWISAPELRIPARATVPGGGSTAVTYTLRNAAADVYPFYPRLYTTLGRGRCSGTVAIEGGWQLGFVEAEAFQAQTFGGWGGNACLGFTWWMMPPGDARLGLGVVSEYRVGSLVRNAWDRALATRVRQEIDTSGWTLGLGLHVTFDR